jgi:hypothetical protein
MSLGDPGPSSAPFLDLGPVLADCANASFAAELRCAAYECRAVLLPGLCVCQPAPFLTLTPLVRACTPQGRHQRHRRAAPVRLRRPLEPPGELMMSTERKPYGPTSRGL